MTTSRLPYTTTVQALLQRRNGFTLRHLADSLGYPASYSATLSAVCARLPGSISRRAERELRTRLGLSNARPTCGIGGLQPETRAALDALRIDQGLTWDALMRQLLRGQE